jgi:2-iminoacetate synthase
MAQRAQQLTLSRFGHTISLYIPLYLTNSCLNGCIYCGFQRTNLIRRIVLKPEEIEAELRAIKQLGDFQNLLLVTGENPAAAGTDYIERALRQALPLFNNLSIEVMPLKEDEYARLARAGLYGVVCFQETYNRERYPIYHPVGKKADYEWRVNAPDRMGAAGVHKIGMGVLIGLEDWRTDLTMLAHHLSYLRRTYWQTRYSVNFPRMRPSENGHFQPNTLMTDRQYVQLLTAFRIFDPDVDISVSTRESAEFRDSILPLGVTSMSAGSRTDPGGYATHPQSLEQFAVNDSRDPAAVAAAISRAGYQALWRDWF